MYWTERARRMKFQISARGFEGLGPLGIYLARLHAFAARASRVSVVR